VLRRVLLVGALMAMLVGTVIFAVVIWTGLEGVAISAHGWIALGLGVFFATGLGIGLMALVFFSARRGYDDQV